MDRRLKSRGMSAPPPGPQPPTYPPTQPGPYPPQYPPQYPQPYPPYDAPPPKKSNATLIVVVVVVVIVAIVVIGAIFALMAFNSATNQLTRVTITSVSFTIHYNGASSGYFDLSPLTACSSCPVTYTVGTQFVYNLTLENNDTLSAHSVTSIRLGSLFTLVSTQPTLPHSVAAGGTQVFKVTLQVPYLAGSYVLSGTVETT